jgi:hypothetical protein
MAGYMRVDRQSGTDNQPRLVRGLGFVVIGAVLLATLWLAFVRDMGWSGRSGTLTVSACTPGAGPHPVSICQGALRLNDGSAVRNGAWITTQDDRQPGSTIAVQAGSDGSLQPATGSDRLAVGFGVLLCCIALASGLVELAQMVRKRGGRRR